VVCLFSCHEKSTAIAQPNKIAAHAKESKKEIKPGAAIKLVSGTITTLNANELTQVELLFEVKEPLGTLSLELSPTNGLEVLDTQMQQSINLTPSTPIKIPVKLRAMTNGRYYLNIQAGIDNGESSSTRNLALIVQVGAEQEKAMQFKKAAGDNVIKLPAQETILNQ
jgi:hypothetical protein